MTNLPPNERPLTDEEKPEFLRELAELLDRYGVDVYIENDSGAWDPGVALMDINDAWGSTIMLTNEITPKALRAKADEA